MMQSADDAVFPRSRPGRWRFADNSVTLTFSSLWSRVKTFEFLSMQPLLLASCMCVFLLVLSANKNDDDDDDMDDVRR